MMSDRGRSRPASGRGTRRGRSPARRYAPWLWSLLCAAAVPLHAASSEPGKASADGTRALPVARLVADAGGAAGGPLGARADGRADWRPPRTRASDAPGNMPGEASEEPSTGALSGPAPILANTAPELGRIGPQSLVAGRPWRLHVRVRDADGDEPELYVRELPDGARLERGEGGWHVFEWTPPAGLDGDVDLTVGAIDARDRRVRVERVVRLRIAPAPEASESPASEEPESSAPDAPAPTPASAMPRPLAPRIEPLASQIVSVGRTVSFRVVAALEEAGSPLVDIDRLPRGASFERNDDGSYTFFWPTGAVDEGEHRFRITASHPTETALQSRVELLIVVGDPSIRRTVPADAEPADGVSEPVSLPSEVVPAAPAAPVDDALPPWADESGDYPEDSDDIRHDSSAPFDPESFYPPSDAEFFADEGAAPQGFPDGATDPAFDGSGSERPEPDYEADYFEDDGFEDDGFEDDGFEDDGFEDDGFGGDGFGGDGELPNGRTDYLLDGYGRRIDGYGRLIDEFGVPIEEPDQAYDEYGRPVDRYGRPVDE